jgi:hypothetical protein
MRLGGWHLRITLLVGFVACACIYIFFLEPWGHDTWYHIQRMLDIEGQLSRGNLNAHFADNAAQGRGLPVWIYYSQWIYWPPILLKSLGASTLVSLKIVNCILLIVCCAGCYGLLRLHAERDLAAFGSLLFITSNYVIGEVFQRSAYAEFWSVAFLPLLMLAVHRTLRDPGRGPMAAVVLLAGLMILAHPLSFMNAGWALLAYTGYVVTEWKIPVGRLVRLLLLFLLALALVAFYWLPAVIETRYVLGAEGVPTPLTETFMTIPRYFKFYSILSLGFVLTAYAVATAGGVLRRRFGSDPRPISSSWFLVAGIGMCVFLTLGVSEPLYKNISLLASNLWVWRVLFPLTLLVVVFVMIHFRSLPRSLGGERVLDGVAALAVVQGATLVLFYTWSDISTRQLQVEEINTVLAEEMRRLDGFGIDEYLPQPREWPRPAPECPVIRTLVPGVTPDIELVIEEGDARTCIHVPRYWNVRYAASVGGKSLPVFADSRGEILLDPAGHTGTLTLRFARPVYVTYSAYLSAGAAILIFGGMVWRRRGAGSGG